MMTQAWWQAFVPKGVVYDVGANIGETVAILAPLAERVYAFEPNPKCFQELQRATRGMPNVGLFEWGVSNAVGTVRVFTYRHWLLLPVDPADPRYGNPDYHPGQRSELKGEFSVWFTTLDRLVTDLRPPDFIKIDVDGMEWAVLDGGRETLRKYQPILYLEMGVQSIREHGDTAEDLLRLLRESGYAFVMDATGSPVRLTERVLLQVADGVDHNCNVLCLPERDPRLHQWPEPPAWMQ